jgi:hypothetical protein
MYLPSASSSLPGDRERAACKMALSSQRRNAAAQVSVDGRVSLFRTMASPTDLAEAFGPQFGANAKMMQDDSLASRATIMTGSLDAGSPVVTATSPTPQQVIDAAPRSFSLNGEPSQVNGCTWAPAPQVKAPPSPSPLMPTLSPIPTQTPFGQVNLSPGTAPKYSNLCWALRNGMVTQEQFDLTEYIALYRRCSEQGYAGGCAPPSDVATWQARQRAAGTLPHISVGPSELAAIPHVDLGGKTCADSFLMGGMSGGLTGYAPSWSDALVEEIRSKTSAPDTGVGQWVSDHPWLTLAIAVGGAVALSRRGSR